MSIPSKNPKNFTQNPKYLRLYAKNNQYLNKYAKSIGVANVSRINKYVLYRLYGRTLIMLSCQFNLHASLKICHWKLARCIFPTRWLRFSNLHIFKLIAVISNRAGTLQRCDPYRKQQFFRFQHQNLPNQVKIQLFYQLH